MSAGLEGVTPGDAPSKKVNVPSPVSGEDATHGASLGTVGQRWQRHGTFDRVWVPASPTGGSESSGSDDDGSAPRYPTIRKFPQIPEKKYRVSPWVRELDGQGRVRELLPFLSTKKRGKEGKRNTTVSTTSVLAALAVAGEEGRDYAEEMLRLLRFFVKIPPHEAAPAPYADEDGDDAEDDGGERAAKGLAAHSSAPIPLSPAKGVPFVTHASRVPPGMPATPTSPMDVPARQSPSGRIAGVLPRRPSPVGGSSTPPALLIPENNAAAAVAVPVSLPVRPRNAASPAGSSSSSPNVSPRGDARDPNGLGVVAPSSGRPAPVLPLPSASIAVPARTDASSGGGSGSEGERSPGGTVSRRPRSASESPCRSPPPTPPSPLLPPRRTGSVSSVASPVVSVAPAAAPSPAAPARGSTPRSISGAFLPPATPPPPLPARRHSVSSSTGPPAISVGPGPSSGPSSGGAGTPGSDTGGQAFPSAVSGSNLLAGASSSGPTRSAPVAVPVRQGSFSPRSRDPSPTPAVPARATTPTRRTPPSTPPRRAASFTLPGTPSAASPRFTPPPRPLSPPLEASAPQRPPTPTPTPTAPLSSPRLPSGGILSMSPKQLSFVPPPSHAPADSGSPDSVVRPIARAATPSTPPSSERRAARRLETVPPLTTALDRDGDPEDGETTPTADSDSEEELNASFHGGSFKRATHRWTDDKTKTMQILLIRLCAQVKAYLADEPSLVRVSAPAYVMGDLHGNYSDLVFFENVFWGLGVQVCPANLVFLGDFVDRGPHSIETIARLLALKAVAPRKVTLLRGNHELQSQNGKLRRGRLRAECVTQFGQVHGSLVWTAINEVFDLLPLAAVIDDKVFCVHGGIPRSVDAFPDFVRAPAGQNLLDAIECIPRPLSEKDIKKHPVAFDLLWGDPASDLQEDDIAHGASTGAASDGSPLKWPLGFWQSTRGSNVCVFGTRAVDSFLAKTACSHIIRAHQPVELGITYAKSARVVTIFSSSYYMQENNSAAIAIVCDSSVHVVVTTV